MVKTILQNTGWIDLVFCIFLLISILSLLTFASFESPLIYFTEYRNLVVGFSIVPLGPLFLLSFYLLFLRRHLERLQQQSFVSGVATINTTLEDLTDESFFPLPCLCLDLGARSLVSGVEL